MQPKHKSLLAILFISFVMITNFQNCSSPEQMSDGDEMPNSGDSQVSIISDLQPGEKIAFIEPSVELMNSEIQDQFVLDGLCDRSLKDESLEWVLYDPERPSEVLESGTTRCFIGNFSISVSSLADLACNHSYELAVLVNSVATESAQVSINCAN